MTDGLSLREYLEVRLAEMDRRYEQRFAAQERALSNALAASDKALAVAAREYERRLEALNGEQARLAADRERFVSQDAYDTWRDGVNAALSVGAGKERGIAAVWAVGVVVAALILTVVGLLVSR